MSDDKKITSQEQPTDFTEKIMSKITKEQITMKPKWYFVIGAFFMSLGLISSIIITTFLINLILFIWQKRGPGWGRVDFMLMNFPWWILIVAIVGAIAGIWLLKKYDFSYKKNFLLIVIVFVISLLLAAWLIDYSGLNEIWSKRGPMKNFYQQLEIREFNYIHGPDRTFRIPVK